MVTLADCMEPFGCKSCIVVVRVEPGAISTHTCLSPPRRRPLTTERRSLVDDCQCELTCAIIASSRARPSGMKHYDDTRVDAIRCRACRVDWLSLCRFPTASALIREWDKMVCCRSGFIVSSLTFRLVD